MTLYQDADKLVLEFRVREWFRQAKGREDSKIRKPVAPSTLQF